MDEAHVREAVRGLLLALGYNPDSEEGIRETPSRVARAWRELLSGRECDAATVLGTTFEADNYDQIVLLRDIAFYSTCEHHLLPFHGVAHVAYIPSKGGRVVGLSKLARLVDMHARRLQLQERLTRAVADDLARVLAPKGVGVVVEAVHLCMCSRGVSKPGAKMVTSATLGCFRDEPDARAELMSLLGGAR